MRQGLGDNCQHVIHAVIGLQQQPAALCGGNDVGRIEPVEDRQHACHVTDRGQLIVCHPPVRGRGDDHDVNQGFLNAERLAHCRCMVLLKSFMAPWVMLRQAPFKKGWKYLCLPHASAGRV